VNIRPTNARTGEPLAITARSLAAAFGCYRPGVDDVTLARLGHENMLEWLRLTFGRVPGAVISQDRGIGVFATGLPHPFFNQVVTDEGATDVELARAVEAIRRRGQRFYVVLRQPQDDRFGDLAQRLDLKHEADALPGMATEAIPDARPGPAELRIHVVADAVGLEDHATALAGFGLPAELVRPFLGDELWLLPDTTTYVGYVGGEPVVSGFGLRTGRAIGVFSIATLPAARRRGYGEAMTRRVLADGVASGCDVAVLQASSMGRPIYVRLGFRVVQSYAVFSG
jgi:ribosomal protein S18 acetylase RimI-like enzyme